MQRNAQQPKAIIIYGPSGSGKTRNAGALLTHYGKTKLIDEYSGTGDLPAHALALTNCPGVPGAINIQTALAHMRPAISNQSAMRS